MKKILNKKTLITLILIIIIIIAGVFIFLKINGGGENGKLKYEDYTIYKGHEGGIEKYDKSLAIDGQTKNENAYYISGKISANENKKFTIISFNLYDKNDNFVGIAMTGLNELKKDEVYDFKALAVMKDEDLKKIDHYKLDSVVLG